MDSVESPPRRHKNAPKQGNPTVFDKELRHASQHTTLCRVKFGEDDPWEYVIVKYVDQYFIKVQDAEDSTGTLKGKPYWLNKSAIFKFEIGGGR